MKFPTLSLIAVAVALGAASAAASSIPSRNRDASAHLIAARENNCGDMTQLPAQKFIACYAERSQECNGDKYCLLEKSTECGELLAAMRSHSPGTAPHPYPSTFFHLACFLSCVVCTDDQLCQITGEENDCQAVN